MGTETFCKFHELYIRVDNVVKLNNPLMGTETLMYQGDAWCSQP